MITPASNPPASQPPVIPSPPEQTKTEDKPLNVREMASASIIIPLNFLIGLPLTIKYLFLVCMEGLKIALNSFRQRQFEKQIKELDTTESGQAQPKESTVKLQLEKKNSPRLDSEAEFEEDNKLKEEEWAAYSQKCTKEEQELLQKASQAKDQALSEAEAAIADYKFDLYSQKLKLYQDRFREYEKLKKEIDKSVEGRDQYDPNVDLNLNTRGRLSSFDVPRQPLPKESVSLRLRRISPFDKIKAEAQKNLASHIDRLAVSLLIFSWFGSIYLVNSNSKYLRV